MIHHNNAEEYSDNQITMTAPVTPSLSYRARYAYSILFALTTAFGMLIAPLKVNAQTTETIAAGSFIVNMGITPQTVGNGLKLHNICYDKIQNFLMPMIKGINAPRPKMQMTYPLNSIAWLIEPIIYAQSYLMVRP